MHFLANLSTSSSHVLSQSLTEILLRVLDSINSSTKMVLAGHSMFLKDNFMNLDSDNEMKYGSCKISCCRKLLVIERVGGDTDSK